MDIVDRYKADQRQRERRIGIIKACGSLVSIGLMVTATITAFRQSGGDIPSMVGVPVSREVQNARRYLHKTHRDPDWQEVSNEVVDGRLVIVIRTKSLFGGPVLEEWTFDGSSQPEKRILVDLLH